MSWIPEVGSWVRIDHRPSPCHNHQGQLLWTEELGYCVLTEITDREGNPQPVVTKVELSWLKQGR